MSEPYSMSDDKSRTQAGPVVWGQFHCGTRILRVVHGRDARATITDPLPAGPYHNH